MIYLQCGTNPVQAIMGAAQFAELEGFVADQLEPRTTARALAPAAATG
jgi:hypothetical protein